MAGFEVDRRERTTMACPTFDLLQWMDEPVRRAFASLAKRRRYAAGQVIYLHSEPGNEMFRLVSGSVCMSVMHGDGRKVIFLLFEPGDCFGESSLIDGAPRPQTAEALTSVEVDVLDLNSFNFLRTQYRSFNEALLRLLARQMRFVVVSRLDGKPIGHRSIWW